MFDVPLKLRIAGLLHQQGSNLSYMDICTELRVIPIGDQGEKVLRALSLMVLEGSLNTTREGNYTLTADGLCLLLSTDRMVTHAIAAWK